MARHRRDVSAAAHHPGCQQNQPFGGLSDLAHNIDLSDGLRNTGLAVALGA